MQKSIANSVIFNTEQIFVWSRDTTAVLVSVTIPKNINTCVTVSCCKSCVIKYNECYSKHTSCKKNIVSN